MMDSRTSRRNGDFSFLDAVPTAELEPITETYVQSDEVSRGRPCFDLLSFTHASVAHARRRTWG